MTMTRIYVPLDAAGLRRLGEARVLQGDPRAGATLRAHAVTDALRAAHPSSDDEELEYHAMSDAADASAALRGSQDQPRIVVAADIDSSWVTQYAGGMDSPGAGSPGAGSPGGADDEHWGSRTGSSVVVAGPVPLQRVASLHVDEAGASDQDELLWYDVSELPLVLAMV